MTGLRDAITYRLYAGAWALVRRLPERTAYALFDVMADAVWRRRGAGVRQLEANLARARSDADTAELARLSRAGMRSYLRYWCDAFRLPDWDDERVVGSVRVEGEHHLRSTTGEGRRGMVAALMHMGNWDHAGAWASLTGAPVVTVAERLKPEPLFERFLAYREGLGMEILPLTGGDRDLLEVLATRLRSGRLVPLLSDRDLQASGLPVDLLGEPARLAPGPAMLALRTGAALHPVSIWHEQAESGAGSGPLGRRLVIRFHDEIPTPSAGTTRVKLTEMTQQVADVFSEAIAAHPTDWHMLQAVWTADLADRTDRTDRGRTRS